MFGRESLSPCYALQCSPCFNVAVCITTTYHRGVGDATFTTLMPVLSDKLCFLQDREATLQCVLCIRARVEQRKSYACSTDCLRQHWSEHKALHQNGETARQ